MKIQVSLNPMVEYIIYMQTTVYSSRNIHTQNHVYYAYVYYSCILSKISEGWGGGHKPSNDSKSNNLLMDGQDENTFWKHIVTMNILYLRLWHSAKCLRSSAVDKRLCDICSVLSLGMAPAVVQKRESEFCHLIMNHYMTCRENRIWLILVMKYMYVIWTFKALYYATVPDSLKNKI